MRGIINIVKRKQDPTILTSIHEEEVNNGTTHKGMNAFLFWRVC